jgi:hypothetical protein
MALEKNAGWSFWVHEGERVRLFTVADVTLSAAEDMALARTHFGVTISHEQIGEGIINLLKLPYGGVMEWVPAASADDAGAEGVKSLKG